MRRIINTDQAPAPVGPYNQAIAAQGELLFVAGQIALDPATGVLVGEDVTTQTERVLANLQAILQAAGASFSDVVKTTVFLADLGDFEAMNTAYKQVFGDAEAPARICVEVSRLPKNALVEIDCIAVLPT